MDDKQREALEAFLGQLEEEAKNLAVTIDTLREKLGRKAPTGKIVSDGLPRLTASANTDPGSLVTEGEFFGYSGTKATKLLLERIGRARPLRTEEIYAAITKGGVKIGGQGTLYKVLHRDADTFHNLGRGRWGLKVWYPASKTRASSPDEGRDEVEAAEAAT